ncbi:MAG: hypothetical protein MZW92_64325 [Comamonadaceae bacterium]|nr:hypothetical protein [Comamonadaceae bacterium]
MVVAALIKIAGRLDARASSAAAMARRCAARRRCARSGRAFRTTTSPPSPRRSAPRSARTGSCTSAEAGHGRSWMAEGRAAHHTSACR